MKNSTLNILRFSAGSLFLAGVGAYVYATQLEPRRYRLERVSVTTGNGARRDDFSAGPVQPLKILHLSDLHLCHPESHKLEFLRRITDDQYDLVVVTGDVFENYTGMTYASSILSRPPRLGAYAVLGNHDYYNYSIFNRVVGRVFRKFRQPKQMRDVAPLVKALQCGGFTVLRNQAVSLPENRIHIVGIDYPGVGRERLAELVSAAPPDHLLLVLFHIPRNLEDIEATNAHIALGGHTHGGQIRLPGVGAIITDSELPRHQASGLLWRGKTAIHISRGLGADPRTNIRFLCPPAATVIEVCHQP